MSDDHHADLARAIETLRDRRAVLRGAAVAGLAGVSVPLLAACGGEGETAGGPSDAPTSAAPSSAPTSGPSSAPSSGPSAEPTTSGGPVLAATSAIPVGGGMVFKDAKIVVTQPTKGEFKGFTAVCTHSGCLVAEVKGDTIDCNCHGSKFSVTDGSVANGPADSPLAAVTVTVQGGNVLGPAS